MTDSGAGCVVVAEKKGKKTRMKRWRVPSVFRRRRYLYSSTAAKERKKKRKLPQDLVDYILSWDVSDYVSALPDNMDYLPLSDEWKAEYRARRKQAVAVMQQSCRTRRKIQEWVKAEVEKHGYVEIETTDETTLEKQLEEYIDDQIA